MAEKEVQVRTLSDDDYDILNDMEQQLKKANIFLILAVLCLVVFLFFMTTTNNRNWIAIIVCFVFAVFFGLLFFIVRKKLMKDYIESFDKDDQEYINELIKRTQKTSKIKISPFEGGRNE